MRLLLTYANKILVPGLIYCKPGLDAWNGQAREGFLEIE